MRLLEFHTRVTEPLTLTPRPLSVSVKDTIDLTDGLVFDVSSFLDSGALGLSGICLGSNSLAVRFFLPVHEVSPCLSLTNQLLADDEHPVRR